MSIQSPHLTHVNIKTRFDLGLKITELELEVTDLPSAFENYKIVSLTDFHCGVYTNPNVIDSAISLTKSENPDLIFMLGDYVHSGRQEFKLAILKLLGIRRSRYREYRRGALNAAKILGSKLKDLTPVDGIYSVWGNHDYIEGLWILNCTLPKSINHLKNETVTIYRHAHGQDQKLSIFGLDDVRYGKPDFSALTNSDFENAEIKIMLSHNPDFVLLPDAHVVKNFNLILSGHTHGGQVCLPGQTPIKTETRQRNYHSGFYRYSGSPFYIANGIGCSGLPLRLNCPPEMVVVTLKSKVGSVGA